MSRLFVFVLLLTISTAQNNINTRVQVAPNVTTQNRIGLKLLGLGLYLASLGTAFGVRGSAVQTEPEVNTQAPGFPTLPPFPTAITGLPFQTTTGFLSDDTTFPTGIVTSVGFPSTVPVAQTVFPTGVSISTAGLTQCACAATGTCVSRANGNGGVDVRVVTPPPNGQQCPAGQEYCCTVTSQFSCGLPNIIAGVRPGAGQANLGEFPWSVIIYTSDEEYVAGGALIDANNVLTAAHRVLGRPAQTLKVRLGDWDRSVVTEPVRYLERPVLRVITHPAFEVSTLRNDLAVVVLGASVPLLSNPSPQINSICLPNPTDIFTGDRCFVAGWGKDNFNGIMQTIIKKVDVPVLGSVDCQNRLRQTRLGPAYGLDTNSFVCAGGEANKDACTGDGGNALACSRNGQFYLAGIAAGGVACGTPGVPGLYVNVVNFLTWINSVSVTNTGIDPRRQPRQK